MCHCRKLEQNELYSCRAVAFAITAIAFQCHGTACDAAVAAATWAACHSPSDSAVAIPAV